MMTAPDTPSREMLALADECMEAFLIGQDIRKKNIALRKASDALRLAAKPADDGVREAAIEESVAVLEGLRDQAKRNRDRKVGTRKQGVDRGHGTRVNRVMVLGVAIRAIRALSTKAKP